MRVNGACRVWGRDLLRQGGAHGGLVRPLRHSVGDTGYGSSRRERRPLLLDRAEVGLFCRLELEIKEDVPLPRRRVEGEQFDDVEHDLLYRQLPSLSPFLPSSIFPLPLPPSPSSLTLSSPLLSRLPLLPPKAQTSTHESRAISSVSETGGRMPLKVKVRPLCIVFVGESASIGSSNNKLDNSSGDDRGWSRQFPVTHMRGPCVGCLKMNSMFALTGAASNSDAL